MRADYGDVKLKIDGEWFLMDRADLKLGHFLYHQCSKKDPTLYPVEYEWGNWQESDAIRHTGGLEWRCLLCLKVAHEGIVAAWMMLEPDRTWKHIEEKHNE